jgi:small-conductance mechanosensitive channel
MAEQMAKVKQHARPWRSIFALILAFLALGGSRWADHLSHTAGTGQRFLYEMVSDGTAVVFAVLGFGASVGLSAKVRDMLKPRMGVSHTSMVRLVAALFGCGATFLITLELFNLPVGQLVVGGALTGVLLGIAAQQTLANLFAGIILLLAKPFGVGDAVQLRSGAMGGEFQGIVLEIGLTYVRLDADNGVVSLPNAQVLAAAVGPRPKPEPPSE